MKTVLGFLFTMLMATVASAGVRGFNGNSNLGLVTGVKCSSGTSCSKVGGNLVVTTSQSNILQNQVASTTTSITSSQCGSTFVSDSADVMTLPEASTVLGCRLTFVCGTADDFDVNPADGTDVIGPLSSAASNAVATITPSAGDAIRCTDIGSSITIEAVGANRWSAIGIGNGAWTDVN